MSVCMSWVQGIFLTGKNLTFELQRGTAIGGQMPPKAHRCKPSHIIYSSQLSSEFDATR